MTDLPSETTSELITMTIPEQIAVQLARDILNGVYEVGQKLSEYALAERFGVSRGPIRDAMELLERNAFVRSKPRHSARVNATGRYEVQQLFEVRGAVLGLAARYAARNGSVAEKQQLRDAVDHLEARHKAEPSDSIQFFLEAQRAWTCLFKCAHARTIVHVNSSIAGSAIWQLAIRDRIEQSVSTLPGTKMIAAWKRVVAAIAAGDENEAETAARAVTVSTWNMLRETFPEDDPQSRSATGE